MSEPQAHVLLVLHMHQPSYLNPLTDRYELPWVRLHAVREYHDIVRMLERHPAIRPTVNLVPSLLLQLRDIATGRRGDIFLDLARRPPEWLTVEERLFLLGNFFLANRATMIDPAPRYRELLERRGHDGTHLDLHAALRAFDTQDWLDLQVWHNLAWMGFQAEAEYPLVTRLREQDRGFSIGQRDALLAVQLEIMRGVLDAYARLAARGQVELTTTPLHHPILPLLIDNAIARRSMPAVTLPAEPFAWPDDARAQLVRGLDVFEECFGRRPEGLWPAEGAVCAEMIPMLERAGIRWFATDEEVLLSSAPGAARGDALYRAWNVETAGGRVMAVFRDKALSDLIGFTYQRNPAEAAVADFIERLDAIARAHGEAQIAVILDGENPWEHYPRGGEAFLDGLFTALAAHPLLVTRTVGESLRERPPASPRSTLHRLHAASWIHNDFGVWIGGTEENTAWCMLARARAAIDRIAPSGSPLRAAALEAMYAAQGSDWFWWYGDQFYTESYEIFDRLFRAHVAAVYRALRVDVPPELDEPITRRKRALGVRRPDARISPTLNGRRNSYFEWMGAGHARLVEPGAAMVQGKPALSDLWFGFDERKLYLRLDPERSHAEWQRFVRGEGAAIELTLGTNGRRLRVELSCREAALRMHAAAADANDETWTDCRCVQAALDECLELAVDLADLGVRPGEALALTVRLLGRVGAEPASESMQLIELHRFPRVGALDFHVPDDTFDATHWSVL